MIRNLHKQFLDQIQNGQTVLDLGCGDGSLLALLKEKKSCQGYGIEIDQHLIQDCLKKGVSVYHGDIEEGLKGFSDNSFDIVILSQTLQQVKDPLFIMNEMCRIGKQAIVTFPNFAYWKCRLDLLTGYIPRSKTLPYEWFDTPNIRVVSIKSFEAVCAKEGFRIIKEQPIFASALGRMIPGASNLMAEKGFFVIQKS